MKKKILFLVTNSNIFTGFFQSDIKNISKNYDIYFLVSKFGFDNVDIKKSKLSWFKNFEKKRIVKKIIWIDRPSYTNFYKNIIFNKKLISILNQVKSLNIDFFLLPNRSSYWEEIFMQYFRKKILFCYLINPPSGLDLFNNFNDLKKSLKNKRVYKTFNVKSDNNALHSHNTKPLSNKNYFIFLFYKVNIFLSKQISHFLLPLFLIKKTININSIFYKLDLNFFNFNKIIIFNAEFKIFLKNLLLDNNIKIYLYSNYFINYRIKNYNWIFAYASNDKNALSKLFKYLIMLKKLKKISRVYFKGHPTWKHENIEKSFFNLLKKNGIKYKFLDSYKNINYSRYYGLITTPSSVLLESTYNNPNIKIIGIKKNKIMTSGLLYRFFNSYKKKIIWEPNFINLKNYLKKTNKNKPITSGLKRISL